MYNEITRELHSRPSGRRTRASLTMFVIAMAVLLVDVAGIAVLSGGFDVIDGRLHDRLAVLAVLSLPVVGVVLAVGSALAMMEWYAVRRASSRPSRMTILAACLNLVPLLIGILFIQHFLWMFAMHVGG